MGVRHGEHPNILTLTEEAAGCKESGGKRCKSANGGIEARQVGSRLWNVQACDFSLTFPPDMD
jgi:hypothetical protein